MADSDDKTEAATPRRLSKAREDGNVPLSRELPPLITLAMVWGILTMAGPAGGKQLLAWLRDSLANVGRTDMAEGGAAVVAGAASAAAHIVLPIGLAAIAVGAAATLVQTNFLFTLSKLAPDFARLSPRRGLKRVCSVQSLMDAAKAVAKLTIVGIACWQTMATELPQLRQSMDWQPVVMIERLTRMILHLLTTMMAAQVVVTAADMFWTRYRHARDLRMSRSEVKQEYKDQEGDPVVRNRLRQIRRMRARRRMRDAMRRATVVVANPTHYAVALSYDRERNPAPVVVAKGVDSMALRIRETAAEFGVPVVVNPPLARALHKVEIDSGIPAELYKAVAELIAYVWRLNRRRMPRPAA